MNAANMIPISNLNAKKKRKLKRLKKNMNEVLLLSGKDPSQGFSVDELQPSPNCSNEMDISMKVSRKLHAIRQEVAPPPQVEFRTSGLRGSRLGSQHVAQLAHRSILTSVSKPLWLFIKPYRVITQTVLIRIDTDLECVECNRKDSFIDEFFGRKSFIRMQKEVTNRNEFWKAILNVPISRVEQIKQIVSEGSDPLNSFVSQNLRGNLLMSVEQMADLAYPFPGDAELDGRGLLSRYRIKTTKEKYFAIKADSPLFAIDCEMCVSKNGPGEVTRITLVDERCNVIIDTLVKPYEQITDYVTKFSGITKEMLDPVDVRLEHVQLALSNILPADAILVGHSLEYDLRALRLSHPYCIDVAIVFNLSGSHKQRSSLKTLTNIFLAETIQDKRGHCSVEDAIATMRLIKMKLERGFEFGNVSLGWSFDVWARENGLTNTGARIGTKRSHSEPLTDEDDDDVLEPPPKRDRPTIEKWDMKGRCCDNCGRQMNVKCSVQRCKCRISSASLCVVCCAEKCIKQSEQLDSTKQSEQSEEQLDWSAALGTSSYTGTKPLVEEVMKTKNKSMLCCANEESCFFESTSRTKFYDTRSFQSVDELLKVVGGEILEHNLVMVEMDSRLLSNCDDRPISVHVDNVVESIVSSASSKSLIVLILSSPQESTCRISVKP